MNNEYELGEFEKWLRKRPQVGIATVPEVVVLGVIREFAKAYELAEATDQEMNEFLRGYRENARSTLARTAKKANMRLRYDQDQIEYAMQLFSEFRKHRKGE